MNPRFVHIIALSVLLAAGCSRHGEKPAMIDMPSEEKRNPIQEDTSVKETAQSPGREFSRFVEPDKITTPETHSEESVQNDTAPYYIPAPHLEKALPVRDYSLDTRTGKGQKAVRVSKKDRNKAPDFFRRGRVSGEVHAGFIFDNDLIDYTDRYYTSGLALELYHPAIALSPFAALLPGLKHSQNYMGLIFQQNMYTPRKLDKYSVRIGDRPFAAYLALTQRKISVSPEKNRRLETDLTLGVIGPAALGGVAQDAVHPEKPVGWVNQVENDLVANYTIRFEQGLISTGALELAVFAGAQAGTLYDNAKAGVFLQAGRSNGRYQSAFLTTSSPQKPFSRRIRYYFTLDLENKLVFYDATLQGGMIHRESIYTLESRQVKNYVFTGKAGFGIGLGRYSLEIEQVYLTPEFNGGFHHFWFRIRNIVHLN